MAHDVCPVWVGYFLLNPLRKLLENPEKLLGPFVAEGMTVLEPGCGMGYFTLPLARMVGARGQVIAADLQPGMLSRLSDRARKAGLAERILLHQAQPESLGLDHFEAKVDLAVAIHVVHELPNQACFFEEMRTVLQSRGRLLVIEPGLHVSKKDFNLSIAVAEDKGFDVDPDFRQRGRKCLLKKA